MLLVTTTLAPKSRECQNFRTEGDLVNPWLPERGWAFWKYWDASDQSSRNEPKFPLLRNVWGQERKNYFSKDSPQNACNSGSQNVRLCLLPHNLEKDGQTDKPRPGAGRAGSRAIPTPLGETSSARTLESTDADWQTVSPQCS